MKPYFTGTHLLLDALNALTKPLLKQNGYYYAKLIIDWEKIVGSEIAKVTKPLSLFFKKGMSGNAQLVLQVEPSAALIVGFQKGLILQKISAFYGKALVDDLRIKQQHFTIKKTPEKTLQKGNIPTHIEESIRNLSASDLECALRNLGSSVYGKN
jgi:hypothetical protein